MSRSKFDGKLPLKFHPFPVGLHALYGTGRQICSMVTLSDSTCMISDRTTEYIRIASLAVAAYESVVFGLCNFVLLLTLLQLLPDSPRGMAFLPSATLTNSNQVDPFLVLWSFAGWEENCSISCALFIAIRCVEFSSLSLLPAYAKRMQFRYMSVATLTLSCYTFFYENFTAEACKVWSLVPASMKGSFSPFWCMRWAVLNRCDYSGPNHDFPNDHGVEVGNCDISTTTVLTDVIGSGLCRKGNRLLLGCYLGFSFSSAAWVALVRQ